MKNLKELGFSNYCITNDGKLFSLYVNRFLKPWVNEYGYSAHLIHKDDGVKTNVLIHRLVAYCFCSESYTEDKVVNHKDGNKLNNSLDNLEWVTRQDNLYHAMDMGLHNWGRTKVINSAGQEFESQSAAAKVLKVSQGNIHRAIKTGCKCGGYNWRYA